ncbi:hypothetical protein BCR37DRAFT_162324 [Protomyces lactucae-debilis]|uniref:Uncharacterized protein n=1 Tax=Protomyces lactucae-debilis TaxID=2754530 RepID=A0A1Y2EZU1_PROLT|nr:uncharacterized protein BCR37DRAFT_162324 [Protomyces lactucae-debilis]ORY76636.1 hypothetical protein BCR37DRAFT_162324 [Protomyces lactucae-debilis]
MLVRRPARCGYSTARMLWQSTQPELPKTVDIRWFFKQAEYLVPKIPTIAIQQEDKVLQIASMERYSNISLQGIKAQNWKTLRAFLLDPRFLKPLEMKIVLLLPQLERIVDPTNTLAKSRLASQDQHLTAHALLQRFNHLDTKRLAVCPERDLPIRASFTLANVREEYSSIKEDHRQARLESQLDKIRSTRQQLTEHISMAEKRRQLNTADAARLARLNMWPSRPEPSKIAGDSPAS